VRLSANVRRTRQAENLGRTVWRAFSVDPAGAVHLERGQEAAVRGRQIRGRLEAGGKEGSIEHLLSTLVGQASQSSR
jgi:hypothetical protein